MSEPRTHHPAGPYVLRYLDPAPSPPYTRIEQLALAPNVYYVMSFTVGQPQPLTAREAALYGGMALPAGLVLVRAAQVVGKAGAVYQLTPTDDRDASEET